MPRALVVDDEPELRAVLGEILEREGLEVVMAEDGAMALERFRQTRPSVVLLDLHLPKLGGMEVLPALKAVDPRVSVIILTAYGDVPSVVQAMRLGAYDYVTKPFDPADIVLRVRRSLERQELLSQLETLKGQVGAAGALTRQMGASDGVRRLIEQVGRVADSNFTVLIQGETGTGKELVARAIHSESARREKPFIALDCGAIPETLIESELFGYEKGAFTGADRKREGHFQLAQGGTLFLDEIVNLPLTTQAKLLRALQEREILPLGSRRSVPVDVRIIVASNQSLEAEALAGRFRQDLYYRLNEFTINVPPLRERRDDILHLANRFVDEAGMELGRPVRGLSKEAEAALLGRSWPGNVRELRNVVRRAVLVSSGLIEPAHLAAPGSEPVRAVTRGAGGQAALLTLKEVRDSAVVEAERQAIRLALQVAHGNKSEAARLLKTDYKTLHVKIKQYGLQSMAREAGRMESLP